MQDRALASNLEQERLANYRRVLHQLHEDRYVEYDRRSGAVVISPRGERYVEEGLVAKLQ
jgi:hypothetical protein